MSSWEQFFSVSHVVKLVERTVEGLCFFDRDFISYFLLQGRFRFRSYLVLKFLQSQKLISFSKMKTYNQVSGSYQERLNNTDRINRLHEIMFSVLSLSRSIVGKKSFPRSD